MLNDGNCLMIPGRSRVWQPLSFWSKGVMSLQKEKKDRIYEFLILLQKHGPSEANVAWWQLFKDTKKIKDLIATFFLEQRRDVAPKRLTWSIWGKCFIVWFPLSFWSKGMMSLQKEKKEIAWSIWFTWGKCLIATFFWSKGVMSLQKEKNRKNPWIFNLAKITLSIWGKCWMMGTV